jgi:type II secretory pathway pseudopilin PulG
LVEILVAVTILGISIVGIFGALSTFLEAGTVDRSVANVDQVLRTYSEGLIATSYLNCASSYPSVTLRYWNGDNPATFASSCGVDKGVQQISVTVQSATGQSAPLVIAKNSS